MSVENSLLMHHIYCHSEDLDGWLAQPNEPLLPIYRECFAALEGLQMEADDDLHELRIVLNSGKAPGYLEEQARSFGGRFVIGCNGAAWREVGSATRLFAPPCGDFAALRALLGVAEAAEGVVELRLLDGATEVAIEEGSGGTSTTSFSPSSRNRSGCVGGGRSVVGWSGARSGHCWTG